MKRNDRTARFIEPLSNDSAATAVEYGLITGLVALAIAATVSLVGSQVLGFFQSVAQSFTNH